MSAELVWLLSLRQRVTRVSGVVIAVVATRQP